MLPGVFRGSVAVAAGLVTPARLRGPHFTRVFPDVYVRAAEEPPDLALRSRAAALLVGSRGVLSGYSAAELLGAPCAPWDAPAEVTLHAGRLHAHPGLLVRRDRLATDEQCRVRQVPVTSPARTAYDLARRLDLTDAVVAVDAVSNAARFSPDLLLHLAARYPGARGNARVADVLAHADRRSGSPMETRLRMIMLSGGLPRPEVQWVVQDEVTRTAVWLDMAYPDHRIGVEFEGEGHARPEQVLRDIGRYTRLVDRGWRLYRYTKYDVYAHPERIVAELARALTRSSGTGALF